ncbi:unnamed protein product [Vitrella brassicaformis CCMP3155]|uniref:Cytochrome P450 n=1 Tax=Vitrella brassicaformis (strain CCMP3155) TaxID=1169540 RepID=A0A0G4ESS6_VITBC|nr:unnamed protein product [Vitrella brassicaformis CCMP3155]|mmetsp:Transcript_45543/g.113104  ORF Transcript_45543/g.113104 Transcript_45543/m.113104 type:complete len:514 (-) Transcript_45543:408-1949(-)|eukprot:CEM01422.1 unnamed protein product [Vitrella brassicaformis CCMP3155]
MDFSLKTDTAGDILWTTAKCAVVIGAGSVSACVVGQCVCSVTRYLMRNREYKDLAPRKGVMPFVRAFAAREGKDKGLDGLLEDWRDPEHPDQFLEVVDVGPDFEGRRVVGVNQPAAIAEVLADPDKYPKSPFYETLVEMVGHGLVTSSGALWQRQRKLLTPLFHFSTLKAVHKFMTRNADRLVQQLQDKAAKSTDGTTIGKHDISALTLRVMCDAAFARCEFDVDWLVWAWEKVNGYPMFWMGRHLLGHAWMYVPLPSGLGVQILVKRMRRRIINEIARRRAAGSVDVRGEEAKDLLDELLAVGNMPDKQIVDEALTFLVAGHETTSNLVSWTLYFLSKHPDVQGKVQSEIDDLGGRPITFDELPKLEYLRCVLKEVMRVRPIVPFVDRLLKEPLTVNGITLPKGTIVWLNFMAVQNDARYWPAPSVFRPERWMEGTEGTSQPMAHSDAFLPFSAGPRNCIGQKFAMQEAQVIISSLLRSFSVSLDGKDRVMPLLSLTVAPANLALRVTKRDA